MIDIWVKIYPSGLRLRLEVVWSALVLVLVLTLLSDAEVGDFS